MGFGDDDWISITATAEEDPWSTTVPSFQPPSQSISSLLEKYCAASY